MTAFFQKTRVLVVSLENRKLNENLIYFFYSLYLSLFLDTLGFWKQKGEESKRSKSLPHTSTSPTIVITEHSGTSSSLDLNFKIKSIETMAESPMPSPSFESKMDDTSFESITSSTAAARMTNKNSHKASTIAKCQKKSVTLPPASLTNEEIQEKSRTPPIQKGIQRQSTLRYAECNHVNSSGKNILGKNFRKKSFKRFSLCLIVFTFMILQLWQFPRQRLVL